MIRIFVIDDHPVVREGLVAVLEDQEDFHVVGSAESAEAALVTLGQAQAEVILLDLELPGVSGIEAIPALLTAAPGTKIVAFTAYETDELVLGALKAGARGYLLKGAPAAEIARAIRIVNGGGTHLEPRAAARVVAQISNPHSSTPLLTRREMQVLRLVARGLPNKQIASTLDITLSTVKYHLGSIYGKLGAENRAQAVALAVQHGILA